MKRLRKNFALITIVFGFLFTAGVKVEASETVDVAYRTHVQRVGWQDYVYNGEVSGTTGQALRLEGIEIDLPYTMAGGVEYSTHVQTYGWMDWAQDGQMSGTQGQAKRLEAIKIQLTGELANHYDIYYRVHAQSFGWLDWAKNGEPAGTAGFAYRLEGIQIQVLPKWSAAPGNTNRSYVEYVKPKPQMSLNYTTHVQSYGWQPTVSNGKLSGTIGQAKRLEGIKISISDPAYWGGVTYRTHVQTYGWQGWQANGQMSGTQGEAKRLEAIEIALTDDLAYYYDIYYRVHAQSFGWLGWAKNGEPAGTAGYAYRLEGIEIQLVEKGAAAPGSTGNAYREKVASTGNNTNPYVDEHQLFVDAYGNGLVKGSRQGIYHVPGSEYYNRTTSPQAWFKTVAEAKNAGYRAPIN